MLNPGTAGYRSGLKMRCPHDIGSCAASRFPGHRAMLRSFVTLVMGMAAPGDRRDRRERRDLQEPRQGIRRGRLRSPGARKIPRHHCPAWARRSRRKQAFLVPRPGPPASPAPVTSRWSLIISAVSSRIPRTARRTPGPSPVWTRTVSDSISFATRRPDVDPKRIGLCRLRRWARGSRCRWRHGDRRVSAVVENFGGLPEWEDLDLGRLPPVLILHGDADRNVPRAGGVQAGSGPPGMGRLS